MGSEMCIRDRSLFLYFQTNLLITVSNQEQKLVFPGRLLSQVVHLYLTLGVKSPDQGLNIVYKIISVKTESYIKQNSKKMRKLTKKVNKAKELDIDKLKIANGDLADVLNELALVEKNNIDIKLELSNTLV